MTPPPLAGRAQERRDLQRPSDRMRQLHESDAQGGLRNIGCAFWVAALMEERL